MDRPFRERRKALEDNLTGLAGPCFLTRATTDTDLATRWFQQFEGAGLDGVVAKPLWAPYRPNVRAMLKIKHARTADVVLAGYRLHKNSTEAAPLLGSLLLGLYDDGAGADVGGGRLHHIGCVSFVHRRSAAPS